MDKLTLAHEFAMKLAELKVTNKTEDIIRLGWEYADAMQAEAKKREDTSRPDVLNGTDSSQLEWQPDWSVAPAGSMYWMKLSSDVCIWLDATIIKISEAPSFDYTGSWRGSLRKRP